MQPADSLLSLLLDAREAGRAAYAPYSRFQVGAAVLAGGKTFRGVNVENASSGLTICAERVAIFSAVVAGCRDIQAIALSCLDAGPDGRPEARMPCGACRQVMAEFAGPETVVAIDGVGNVMLTELLPQPFLLSRSAA